MAKPTILSVENAAGPSTTFDVKCGEPFNITVKVRGYRSPDLKVFCTFRETSPCRFLIGDGISTHSIRKHLSDLSFDDAEVTFDLTVDCHPHGQNYSTILRIEAENDQGEEDIVPVGLSIEC